MGRRCWDLPTTHQVPEPRWVRAGPALTCGSCTGPCTSPCLPLPLGKAVTAAFWGSSCSLGSGPALRRPQWLQAGQAGTRTAPGASRALPAPWWEQPLGMGPRRSQPCCRMQPLGRPAGCRAQAVCDQAGSHEPGAWLGPAGRQPGCRGRQGRHQHVGAGGRPPHRRQDLGAVLGTPRHRHIRAGLAPRHPGQAGCTDVEAPRFAPFPSPGPGSCPCEWQLVTAWECAWPCPGPSWRQNRSPGAGPAMPWRGSIAQPGRPGGPSERDRWVGRRRGRQAGAGGWAGAAPQVEEG